MVMAAKPAASIVMGAPNPSVRPRAVQSPQTMAEWALGMPPVLRR